MEKIDFSIDGMLKMQIPPSDTSKIHNWLMFNTSSVKLSLLENLRKDPAKGPKLIRTFGFLIKKHVSITEKLIFLERWQKYYVAELIEIAHNRIDKSVIDELNKCISEICYKAEEDLFEAYQDQKIDPIKRHMDIRVKSVLPFSYYLKNIEKKDEFIKILMERYPRPIGVQCARMIVALDSNGLLMRPNDIIDLYDSIANQWKLKKFQRQGVDKKLGEVKYYSDERKKEYTNNENIEINYIKDVRNNLLTNATE
jgi:predicted transcriptional regulator YdeE